MRPLLILSAVLLTSATPAFAQVTVDLHALEALPEHHSASQPPRAERPRTPTVAAARAPVVQPPAPVQATASKPAAPAAPQPAMPEAVPSTASIEPIEPQPPAPGAQPPAPPPVSDKSTTAAAPTTAGLRLTFAPSESDLSPESSASIKELTSGAPLGDLTTFNVMAYAPGKPDDPSTARRVSLSRAMAVRSALIADGVPSARIFVRALGEQYGDGPPDRVDLSVMGANAPSGSAAAR
jgi:outer membrane protein OmpA-like peptidoglycan-associated protein